MINFPGRPNYIDLAKILGIYLVLLGHYVYFIGVPFLPNSSIWSVTHFVTLFHMPFFFFVSGMLCSKKFVLFRDFFNQQCKTLLIPYLLFCILIGGAYYGAEILQGTSSLVMVKFFIGILVGGDFYGRFNVYPVGPIWFLYVLFVIKLLYFVVEMLKNVLIRRILFVFLWVIGLAFICLNKNYVPCRIDSVFVGLIFYAGGVNLKNYVILFFNSKKKSVFIFLVSSFCLYLLFEFYLDLSIRQGLSINANFYGKWPLMFVVSGFVGSFFLLSLASFFPIKSNSKIILNLSSGMIVTLATHKVIYFAISKVFYKESVLAMFCTAFIVLGITYLLILVVQKCFPMLMGFRKK